MCDPGESRTPNLLIRSQMLYPIKLQDQTSSYAKIRCKGTQNNAITKFLY
jgi:hypothetical protein